MAGRLPLLRLAVLSTVLLFALVVLGLAAAIASTTSGLLIFSFTYSALAIATSVITMATVPAMIALEIIRPGGVISMIIVEIGWLSFLWIMWLATGAEAAEASAAFSLFGGCADSVDLGDGVEVSTGPVAGLCRETSAIAAFAFLNWVMLMGYTSTLLIMSLVAQSRKHIGVWQSSVADAPLFAPAASGVPRSYHADTHGTARTVNAGVVHV